MLTEKDYKVIEKAAIYDLRLIFSNGEKDTYTREEIVELLDKIAMAKDVRRPLRAEKLNRGGSTV